MKKEKIRKILESHVSKSDNENMTSELWSRVTNDLTKNLEFTNISDSDIPSHGAYTYSISDFTLYKDVTEIYFESLYPRLMIQHSDELFETTCSEFFEIYEIIFDLRGDIKRDVVECGDVSIRRLYKFIRMYLNYTYGILSSKHNKSNVKASADLKYEIPMLAHEILKKIKDNFSDVIYCETDTFFIRNYSDNKFELTGLLDSFYLPYVVDSSFHVMTPRKKCYMKFDKTMRIFEKSGIKTK